MLRAWMQRQERIEERKERVIELYDSGRPTDSVTGTPPLVGRIRERYATKSRSDSRGHAESAKSDTSDIAIKTVARASATDVRDTERDLTESVENESREAKGGNSPHAWICILLTLITLAGIIKTIKQRSNRH